MLASFSLISKDSSYMTTADYNACTKTGKVSMEAQFQPVVISRF